MASGNQLYLECYSGISGDMTVAALLDLGADEEVLREALESLPVSGYQIEIKRVVKSGIDACDFHVILDKAHENHDHDMEYLHGHAHGESYAHEHEHIHGEGHVHEHEHVHGESYAHEHGHVHGEGHAHEHEHVHGESYAHEYEHIHGESHAHEHEHAHGESYAHEHEHIHGESHVHEHEQVQGEIHLHAHEHPNEESPVHSHAHVHGEDPAHSHAHIHEEGHAHGHAHHEHRGMREIREIIEKGKLTKGARELALRIFEILAEAESKAHNVPKEEVHFHEVGAVDSIVDIVAAAVCLDDLGIEEVVVPVLCEGRGTVRCQHGILPIPVPATANIMAMYRLPLRVVAAEGEFVTPTGAAIVAAVKTSETLPKDFSVVKVGIGAGKRDYERPGILRAMLIEPRDPQRDTIWKLETNIDDCSGEVLGYVMERLFEAGARDVHYMPVFMKKNRPAWQLNVICAGEDIKKLEQILFRETTTIGIRRVEMDRTVLEREERVISTPFGEAQIKVCRTGDMVRFYPEYESVSKLARESGEAFAQVYRMVQRQGMEEAKEAGCKSSTAR